MVNQKFSKKVRHFIAQTAEDLMFKTLLDTVEVNFYCIDRDGYALSCNNCLSKRTVLKNQLLKKIGFNNVEEITGRHILELGSTEVAWMNSQKVMNSGKTMTFEEIQTTNDGRKIYYHSIKTPIFDDDNNEVIGLVGISIDITERKRYEEELKQARAELQAAQDELLDYKVASKISYKQSLEIYRQLKHENETLKLRLKFGPEY